MAKPKFTLYKHGKVDGELRWCRATVPSNNKVKRHIVLDRFHGIVAKANARRRRRPNPEGTYNNKFGHVAIFLKVFGVSVLAASAAVRAFAGQWSDWFVIKPERLNQESGPAMRNEYA